MSRLTLLAVTLASGVAFSVAASAQTAQPAPTQQNRMATCNADAKAKELSGDVRKSFMSECLSNKTAATAPAVQPAPAKPVVAAAPAVAPAPARPVAIAPAQTKPTAQVAAPAAATASHVSLNTATSEQLDGLWGIGKARAATIIANRPYKSVDDFHNRHLVPENVFVRIKDQLSL